MAVSREGSVGESSCCTAVRSMRVFCGLASAMVSELLALLLVVGRDRRDLDKGAPRHGEDGPRVAGAGTDPLLELPAELLDDALAREGGGIGEDADGLAAHHVADVEAEVEVFHAPVAAPDPP